MPSALASQSLPLAYTPPPHGTIINPREAQALFTALPPRATRRGRQWVLDTAGWTSEYGPVRVPRKKGGKGNLGKKERKKKKESISCDHLSQMRMHMIDAREFYLYLNQT